MSKNDSKGGDFDIEVAKKYWRYAPSGKGKVNSEDLLKLDDTEFYEAWNEHFQSRVSHYWEEGRIVPYFANLFGNKRVLSFGSGLGLNEMHFLRAGAQLTCADIVETNLQVIKRVAKLENLRTPDIIHIEDSPNTKFGGPFDYIYANGSIMTMPWDQQKIVFKHLKESLSESGKIILMLYTWKFVAETCGVDSPTEFARRSDPSVAELDCPWSDWHDESKVMTLAGSDMTLENHQLWNQGYYAWYGLRWRTAGEDAPPKEFLTSEDLFNAADYIRQISIENVELSEAEWLERGPAILGIKTKKNNFLYAALSESQISDDETYDEIRVDADLVDGAFSLSILDEDENIMIMSAPVTWKGRHLHCFSVPSHLPRRFRIVFSNYREGEPASSTFRVYSISLARRVAQ